MMGTSDRSHVFAERVPHNTFTGVKVDVASLDCVATWLVISLLIVDSRAEGRDTGGCFVGDLLELRLVQALRSSIRRVDTHLEVQIRWTIYTCIRPERPRAVCPVRAVRLR